MNIFCDIDGTLTDSPRKKCGEPNYKRIKELQKLAHRHRVVLWSGNGIQYAEEFKDKYGLRECIALGKPHILIDDNPTIRPKWCNLIKTPEYLDNDL